MEIRATHLQHRKTLRSNTILSRCNLNYIFFLQLGITLSQILSTLSVVHQSVSCVILLSDYAIAFLLTVELYMHNKVALVSSFDLQ